MPKDYEDLNPPSIPFNDLEPYSPDWEQRVENFNENNISSIDESPDGCEICITYKIDTPDKFPQLPYIPDIPDLPGRGRPTPNPGLPEIPNPIDIIEEEFEERFGGGQYTVCVRKRNCPPEPLPPPPDLPIDDESPYVELPGLPPDRDPQVLRCPRNEWVRFNFSGNYYDIGLWNRSRHAGSAFPFSHTEVRTRHFFAWNPTAMRRISRIRISRLGCHLFHSTWQVKAWGVYDPSINYVYGPNAEGWCSTNIVVYAERGSFWACSAGSGGNGHEQSLLFGLMGEIDPPCPVDDSDNENRPPINQPEKSMNCCEEILKRLARIEEKLERMEKWVGSDKGGMQVPEHLQDNSPGGSWLGNAWDAITPDKKRQIKSIPEFFQWYVEKFQETFGILPLVVKDESDAELGFPNFKYAIEGIINKLVMQDKALGTLQLGLAKTLVEIALARQGTILGNSLSDAICTFLDIDLEEGLVEISHQLTIPEDNDIAPEDVDTDKEMLDFLKSSKFLAKEWKFDPRKKLANGKTPITFGTTAFTIQQMWEAYQTQNGVGIDKNNIHNGLRKALTAIKLFSEGKDLLGKPIEDRDAPGWENDLSLWANEVERAFSTIDNPPEGSAEQPWGNNPEERPRIIIRGNPAIEGNDI